MNITNVKNPQFCTEDQNRIMCEIEIENEWMPFVASPNDCTKHGKQIYFECLDGKYGTIKEYEDKFDLDSYKSAVLNELLQKCEDESEKIISQKTLLNIALDSTSIYPKYLQGKVGKTNVITFINIYNNIYKQAESLIILATLKSEIDLIIDNITFPSKEEVLNQFILV